MHLPLHTRTDLVRYFQNLALAIYGLGIQTSIAYSAASQIPSLKYSEPFSDNLGSSPDQWHNVALKLLAITMATQTYLLVFEFFSHGCYDGTYKIQQELVVRGGRAIAKV